jgi:hypothetical protein
MSNQVQECSVQISFKMKLSLFFACLFLPMSLIAQVEFRGRVLDLTTQSGIPHASVFLPGSTFGISTDESGLFSF